MSHKMINFSMDPSDPKLADPSYISQVKFNLEVKLDQLRQLERVLNQLESRPESNQSLLLKTNVEQIREMVEEFVDESIESFDSLVFDEELALLGAEFSHKLRLIVDQTQALLISLEKDK